MRLNYRKYIKWLRGEALEQARFVEWLELNGYIFSSIPNSVYTTSFKQKIMNSLLGLRPGLCDLMIVLKRGSLLFLEMKKERGIQGGMNGSVISPDQEKWVSVLDSIDNVSATFAHGCDEAIRIVLSSENL